MFMQRYPEFWSTVDPIAERIRAVGHWAPGSYAQFAQLASIPDVPASPPKAFKMVSMLATGHEAVARTARDLLTQRIDIHEKTAWMLRSLLAD